MKKSSVLLACLAQTAVVKPLSLGGDKEVTIRELYVGEAEQHDAIARDESLSREERFKKMQHFTLSCAMVKPKFFTEEELESLTVTGQNFIGEVYTEVSLIGKTEKEREEFFERVSSLTKVIESEEASKEKESEETEKK